MDRFASPVAFASDVIAGTAGLPGEIADGHLAAPDSRFRGNDAESEAPGLLRHSPPKLLSLLMILEVLRQEPGAMRPQKV